MKPHKITMLVVLLGLLLAVFAICLAQDQNTQAKKEATSPMDSCCCKGDSCEMKEGMSNTAKKDGCCGESCDMKMKESMKNHTEGSGCCCCGESCDMKKDASMKNHAADAKRCCGATESCEMKTSDSMQSQSSGHNCCCNNMDHKNMQHMKAKQKAA